MLEYLTGEKYMHIQLVYIITDVYVKLYVCTLGPVSKDGK